jgi:hypothetical protein
MDKYKKLTDEVNESREGIRAGTKWAMSAPFGEFHRLVRYVSHQHFCQKLDRCRTAYFGNLSRWLRHLSQPWTWRRGTPDIEQTLDPSGIELRVRLVLHDSFVFAIWPDRPSKDPRTLSAEFWEAALGDDALRIQDADFFTGFVVGALKVWYDADKQL